MEARRERLSADGGALLLREVLRTPLQLQGRGWTDQADVDVLRDDPPFRLSVPSRRSDRPRRVVLIVLERPERTEAEDGTAQERLFLDPFFLVTNASIEDLSPEELLERYRGRGYREGVLRRPGGTPSR